MGQCFLTIHTMKIFVFLSLLSLVHPAPAPQDEAVEAVPYIHEEIEALPYEHDTTGDVAETYVHEEIEAIPYTHEEIAEDQEEPDAAALVVPHAVYSYSPLAPVAVTQYAGQPDGVKLALFSPFPLVAGYIQDEMIKQGKLDVPYKGIGECAPRTMKNEGALSFWRGNLANCIRYFPTQALNFAFKDKIKALFATPKTAPQWQKFVSNILSVDAAVTLSLLFVYSLDFARTKLANDAKGKGGERQYSGLIDVYVETLKSDGIQGLYRGFTISAVGIFIYR